MRRRIVFIADGRSPITRGWLSHFTKDPYESHLVSTFPCDPPEGIASTHIVPVAFSGAAKSSHGKMASAPGGARGIHVRSLIRHWLGPLTVPRASAQVQTIIQQLDPDLVHALRIPFEGMLAAGVDTSTPLLTSVWGNDFTLHAEASRGMRRLTYETMTRSDALHTDCHRDIRLAREWGFSGNLSIVLPGGGGIRRDIFHPDSDANREGPGIFKELTGDIPAEAPVIINPRGFRTYVRNDTFFKSIPLILKEAPDTVFLCVGMRGEKEAVAWLDRLKLWSSVRLLPRLNQHEMAATFRRAWISASPSEHDGTPNTLLESLACGCFPVAGDIESIREWVDDGRTGLLTDPANPDAWAAAIIHAIRDESLRRGAHEENQRIIMERAEFGAVGDQAQTFYEQIIG